AMSLAFATENRLPVHDAARVAQGGGDARGEGLQSSRLRLASAAGSDERDVISPQRVPASCGCGDAMNAQRIFISGVAGFLGSHLADSFLADGHHVIGIDNMLGGEPDNVPARVEFYQVDCNDSSRLRTHMEGVDVVFHCAATPYEGASVFSPHLVTQNIVTATTGMKSAALSRRVRRFVLCSSMARYGSNPVPFTEDMTPKPQDPYGIGKYAAELLLANLAETHGMEWAVAVPHNLFVRR